MPVGDFNPVPKPRHRRNRKTAKQRGQVTEAVYAEAWKRSGGRCERCGKWRWEAWTLEAAHVERRWKASQDGIGAEDILILCGPSTLSGTCHNWADSTKEGRAWLRWKHSELEQRTGDRS